jgi:hypothetical protein
VYVVRVEALTAGQSSPLVSASQQIVVVPVQAPVASFKIVRAEGPNGSTLPVDTATQPIAIVPQAELPEVDSQAQDRIVREDFWFEPIPSAISIGTGPALYTAIAENPPDLTCLSDGVCGHYTGAALVPDPSKLNPEPGETTLSTGPVAGTGPWVVGANEAPTGGFPAIEMNFWDQALADMGSPGGVPELPSEGFGNDISGGTPPPVINGYPQLDTIDLADVDGFEGEQGSQNGCFPGYPDTYVTCLNTASEQNRIYGGYEGNFGPFDNDSDFTDYQGEDEYNFLYNYSTVVGVDSALNAAVGPATGATTGPDGTIVPRQITMIAYDAEGVASAPVTLRVPLTPATGPTVQACIEVASGCVTSGAQTTPLTAGQVLHLNVAGSSGGTGQILYYAVHVGQTNSGSTCSGSTPVTSPTVPPPFPVPTFSDLEAGAFPYHNCAAYSEREVSSNLVTAPAPPGSGPNTPAVILRDASGAVIKSVPEHGDGLVVGHDIGSLPYVATDPNDEAGPGYSAVLIVPASELASDPGALKIEFTQPGQYAVAVAAYDYSGLGAVTKISGIVAEPAEQAGFCENVSSAPVIIDGASLGLSGQCLTRITNESGSPLLYASKSTIDLDGVPVTPQPGYAVVANVSNSAASQVYVTKDCSIAASQLKVSSLGSICPDPTSSSTGGALYLALGSASNGPGFAYQPDFFGSKDGVLVPTVSSLPAIDTTAAAQGAVTGCGTSGGLTWSLAGAATYEDLTVTGDPCVTFTKSHTSRIAFYDQLPQGFGNGATVSAPVLLQGEDVPPVGQLSTSQYANVAKAPGRHGPSRVIDGSRITGRAAQAGLPVPNCDASTTSALSIPGNTPMGDLIDLPGAGAQLCYQPATGDFTGNVTVSIPEPLPITGVDVGFEIGHGKLLQAGASVSGNIPVPPLVIHDLEFDIQTDPVVVAGAIDAAIGGILNVDAGVIVHDQPFSLDLNGTVGIGNLQFGNFAVDFTNHDAAMHATIAKDFGPVSLNVTVSGGAEWGGPNGFQFYVDGDGNACLFICLGVQGLVSSEGLAACGTINLLLVKFSGGFAVMWSGPESGLHLFTGCDLEPFIPPGLQNLAGAVERRAQQRGDPGRAHLREALAQQSTLTAGQTEQLTLHPKHGCLPTSTPTAPKPKHCIPSVVAVQVHSLASAAGVGGTPLVTLTGPSGDGRVITTPSAAGAYSFNGPVPGGQAGSGQTDEGTAMVEQSPVGVTDEVSNSSADCPTSSSTTVSTIPASCPLVTTTTIYVADPGPGKWTLTVAAGSPAVVDVSIADSEPPVTAKEFNGAVRRAKLTGTPKSFVVHIGQRSFSSSLLAKPYHLMLAPSVETPASSSTALVRPSARDLDVAGIDSSRLRAIVLKAPKGFQGTMAIIDRGPKGSQLLAGGLKPSSIPAKGLPILFEPTTDPGLHHIQVFLSNSAGMPSSVLTLSKYKGPPSHKPGRIRILRVRRHGATIEVYFKPGNAPISNGISLSLSAGNGQRLEDTFMPGSLKAVGSPAGIGAASQAPEYIATIHGVDPTEPIKVGLNGSNHGAFGPATFVRSGPTIHSRDDNQLLLALVKRHHRKHG